MLKEDIGHSYRKDEDDPDRNSDFLIRSMDNYLDRERYRTNRANDIHSILSQSQTRAGAPSVLDTPGGNTSAEAREQKKKRRQERKARLAAAKAAAAPVPTPKGKRKGKDPKREEGVLLP